MCPSEISSGNGVGFASCLKATGSPEHWAYSSRILRHPRHGFLVRPLYSLRAGVGVQIRQFILFYLLATGFAFADGPTSVDCGPNLAALKFEPGNEASKLARGFYRGLSELFPNHDFYRFPGHRSDSDHPGVVRAVPRDSTSGFETFVVKTIGADKPEERDSFRREVTLLESLPREHFVEIVRHTALSGESETVPLAILKNYPDGALNKSLSSLGPARSPLKILALLKQTVQSISALHRAGWGNGDVKPENFAVIKEGDEIQKIVMMDLGTATRLDVPLTQIPGKLTPQYLDSVSLAELGLGPLLFDVKRRDLDALRKVHQEMVLGKQIGEVDENFRETYRFERFRTVGLSKSPGTVDSHVHPILGALATVRFRDTETWLKAIENAKTAFELGRSELFFQPLFAMYEAEGRLDEFVELVATADEFKHAYQRNYFGIGYFPGAGQEIRRRISDRLTP